MAVAPGAAAAGHYRPAALPPCIEEAGESRGALEWGSGPAPKHGTSAALQVLQQRDTGLPPLLRRRWVLHGYVR